MPSSVVYISKPNRSKGRPKSGYSNFYTTGRGKTGLKIGAVDYGLMEPTPENIAFRDNALAKQGLPPAKF